MTSQRAERAVISSPCCWTLKGFSLSEMTHLLPICSNCLHMCPSILPLKEAPGAAKRCRWIFRPPRMSLLPQKPNEAVRCKCSALLCPKKTQEKDLKYREICEIKSVRRGLTIFFFSCSINTFDSKALFYFAIHRIGCVATDICHFVHSWLMSKFNNNKSLGDAPTKALLGM